MNVFINKKKSCDLWDVSGSFGKLDCDTVVSENSFSADNGKVSVISEKGLTFSDEYRIIVWHFGM